MKMNSYNKNVLIDTFSVDKQTKMMYNKNKEM